MAAAKPAASVVQPPPSATRVPSRPSCSSSHSRATSSSVFAASPGESSCVVEAAAEGELGIGAVDPGDVAVGDERDPAATGDVLAEEGQRTRLDADPGRRERDPVGVPRPRVRDLQVDRLALLVEAPEELLVPGQRPVAAVPDAAPCLLHLDVHEQRQRAVAQRLPHALGEDGAAPEREHGGNGLRQRLDREVLLELPEPGLAALGPDVRDRHPQLPLELEVDVEERPSQACGGLRAEARLAGAHEADERDVPVDR